ncbi:hypothetical protein A2X44_01525 [candidate division CPR3 bacterium GWF2_35_18]|uniref:DUF5667 domain-containing protein n=1 Tax=candidate division CPR3 bacterium GW2011_GWF2_35_18 TaxID=1618350 RepID=A0A0G0BLJ3_UNCC3|nr:MAG: hypothetical protein UR67_C0001G0283 [candidate division CPR3 bacterium GW2011_GWF2_35_18]KKP86476.1 MAG: hypothetical protein UR87_C0018G0005 [candidate division CPR3 bacterium GW2011_GWE2_35_7]OGB63583.1 MAG: hypothetical protein A2X44_01525 [candidate division CPR3 bacterium GWF2_35_18]OGB64692.1 MAG: hypothetical protein A2250_04075 [candidate division CPR3 bacterium RIFOXYA2_FULL_35_13]OGB79084.1 MAG: hypothetical protein A2296_00615 [candidate division CPR3 bacterium RIFOXYB2_FULL
MKKELIFIFAIILIALLPTAANAQNDNASNIGQEESPGNNYENQNQVQTENQGEDSQLQITNEFQEQEGTGSAEDDKDNGSSQSNRSENALEHMSVVAQKVEELLENKGEFEGLGEKIRVIARDQQNRQKDTESSLNKVDSKSKITKFFFGPDYLSLQEMNRQVEQNRLQIQDLTNMKNQLSNEGDQDEIQEMIQAMIDQNTALEERINSEEGIFSLFGWLAKLFVR